MNYLAALCVGAAVALISPEPSLRACAAALLLVTAINLYLAAERKERSRD